MARGQVLRDDQRELIWRLYLRHVSHAVIARQIGCSRQAVTRTVGRIRKDLAEDRLQNFEEQRSVALAEYDEVKREAWKRLAECKASSHAAVGYLGQIVSSRQQQDRLLGLETIQVDHRGAGLVAIAHLVKQPVTDPELLALLPATGDGHRPRSVIDA